MRRLALACLAACSAAACVVTTPTGPVDNRGPVSTKAPPNACPRISAIDGTAWQSILFPQCPSEPFETDLPVCAGAACPRPCRATITDGSRTGNAKIRYDKRGRWLATDLDVLGDPPLEQREATYDEGRLHTIESHDISGQYTETLTYSGAYLVKTWDGGDGEIHIAYQDGRAVEIAHPTGTVNIHYDAAGRVATVLTDSSALAYDYDAAGVLTGVDDKNSGEHVAYSYDANGRLERTSSSTGNVPGPVVVIEHDAAGRITRIGTTTYAYCN